VAYRLNDVKGTKEAAVLKCSSWEFDGAFKRKSYDLIVRTPSSNTGVPIASLEAFPLRFDEELKPKLLARGRTFWSCRHRAHVLYLAPRSPFEAQTVGLPLFPFFSAPSSRTDTAQPRPRFMIDYETFEALHPTAEEDHAHSSLEDVISTFSTDEPNELVLLSLPAQIRGFGFHDKKWSASPFYVSRASQLTSIRNAGRCIHREDQIQ
jgi:hypothetical protein